MLRTLLLLLILALAFFMAFIPHMGYAYPVHLDEWNHLTYSKTISQTGSITFPDPYSAKGMADNTDDKVEVIFRILWAVVQQVSGIDWLVLWRFGPSAIFVFTVLAVYVLANREGYGLEAAFFTCLIPTTVGLLGPAFMVPMALGLFFLPLTLLIVFYIKAPTSHMLIFLIACFLWLLHPPSAAVLIIILIPYIVFSIKNNPLYMMGIIVALLLPIILVLPFLYRQFLKAAGELVQQVYPPPYLEIPPLLGIYGFIPIIFCFIGTIVIMKKPKMQNLGLVLGLVFLLIVMLVYTQFHYGSGLVYDRGLINALIIISMIAGVGLQKIRSLAIPAQLVNRYRSIVMKYFGNILCAFSVVIILVVAIPTRLNATYYHMIDNEDYVAFLWIKNHITTDYITLIDPWKATAFTAITGEKIVRRIWPSKEPADDMIYQYLNRGCPYTPFLTENSASLVYNRMRCDNHDLIEIHDNVYIINPLMPVISPSKDDLQNGRFESVYWNQPPAFWLKWASPDCKAIFLYPEPGRDGGSCIAIKIPETEPLGSNTRAHWGQYMPVQSGATYIIGGWIKTENIQGKGGAIILPSFWAPDSKWLGNPEFMKYIKGTTGWTYYQGTITVPQGAKTCTIACLLADCSGIAWFDDIIFKMR